MKLMTKILRNLGFHQGQDYFAIEVNTLRRAEVQDLSAYEFEGLLISAIYDSRTMTINKLKKKLEECKESGMNDDKNYFQGIEHSIKFLQKEMEETETK